MRELDDNLAEANSMRPDLYRVFYPLKKTEQKEWAEIVQLPVDDPVSRLQEKAQSYDRRQDCHGHRIAGPGSECDDSST